MKKRTVESICIVLLAIFYIFGCYGTVRAEEKQEFVAPENVKESGYDIVFVVDNSKSIWSQQEERDQALRTIANLGVGSNVRIGSVYFADHIYKTFSLISLESEENHADIVNHGLFLRKKDKKNRDTNIGSGLQAGLKLFEDQGTERKKIIILVSDGINENFKQKASYKRAADKKTEKYVKKIKNQGIDLYCVFIQKKRADRQYLKDLVVSAAQTKTQAEDRFIAVKKSGIHQLASSFSKVFYSLQGNMKHKEITPQLLDSEGRYSFYIPELNVYRLEVFLNNTKASIKADLIREDGGKVKKTYKIDEGSIFFTVKNPESGQWIIDVDTNNESTITGSIAYYADIYANSSVEGNLYKGQNVKIKAAFADQEGKAISLDTGAEVTAEVLIKNKKGKVVQKEENIPMTIQGKTASSDMFELKKNGVLSCSLKITYQDFIYMSYRTIDKLAIDPIAPSADKTFPNTLDSISVPVQDSKKEQFVVELNKFITDVDSDITKDMTFEEIQILYEENPVTVNLEKGDIIEEGRLICLADKKDKVQFVLTVTDETGLPVSINVSSMLMNQDDEAKKKEIILAVILVLVICILIYVVRGKMLVKEYKAQSILLREQKDKMEQNQKMIQQETDDNYNTYIKVYMDLMHFVDDELSLENEVQQVLGIQEALNREQVVRLYADINSLKKVVEAVCKNIDGVIHKYEHDPVKLGRLALKTKLKKLIEDVKTLETKNNDVAEKLKQLDKGVKQLAENADDLKEFWSNLQNIQKKTFLSASCSMRAKVMGMECRKSKNMEWFWKLDDFTVMSEGEAVKDVMNKATGMIFFPCEAIEEETGTSHSAVMVGAVYTFDIWEGNASEEIEQTNQAILLKGNEYYIDTKDVAGIIKLMVQ